MPRASRGRLAALPALRPGGGASSGHDGYGWGRARGPCRTSPSGSETCTGDGANGWQFSARVSPDDGLVLETSTFAGRQFTAMVSVPYLDALYTDLPEQPGAPLSPVAVPGQPGEREQRLELTPTPASAGPGALGSSLQQFECAGSGGGDTSVKAVYLVDDSVMYGDQPGGMLRYGALRVTQEYRFRGIDSNPCEPTDKLVCARFWPSLSYEVLQHPTDAGTYPDRGTTGRCTVFRGVRTVQRMQFRPDGESAGAIDAFKERGLAGAAVTRSGVETKGSDGSMKYEDVDTAIRGGHRGDWDSLHQSPTPKTSSPGINLLDLAPGCGSCVHMHWVWGTSVNVADPLDPYTDGKPQILDASTQSADFGLVRDQPGEEDPVIGGGWRRLLDRKGSEASELRGHAPVVYWEMTSSGQRDSTFPVLDGYAHGGNGAVFFGDHAH
jgi:hypothetical protein